MRAMLAVAILAFAGTACDLDLWSSDPDTPTPVPSNTPNWLATIQHSGTPTRHTPFKPSWLATRTPAPAPRQVIPPTLGPRPQYPPIAEEPPRQAPPPLFPTQPPLPDCWIRYEYNFPPRVVCD